MSDRINRHKAVERGYVVDDTCYPWVAYKGPRFQPTELIKCLTDLESELLDATTGLLAACQHHGIKTGTMGYAQEVIYKADPSSAYGRKPYE